MGTEVDLRDIEYMVRDLKKVVGGLCLNPEEEEYLHTELDKIANNIRTTNYNMLGEIARALQDIRGMKE